MDYRCPHCAGVAKPINGAGDTIKCEGEVHCQFMGSKDDFEWVGNEAVSSEAPGYDDCTWKRQKCAGVVYYSTCRKAYVTARVELGFNYCPYCGEHLIEDKEK